MSHKLKWCFALVAVFSVGAMLHNARSLYSENGISMYRKQFSNMTKPSLDGRPPTPLPSRLSGAGHHWTASLSRQTALFAPQHPEVATNGTAPVRILILSYQRSGSTIVSSLFGDDPNMFFVFEPLDALYGAMYGVGPGWSVPVDLTINKDGSLREIPQKERYAVRDYMHSIYNCDFNKVPTEFLVHPFWWYFVNWTAMAKPYVSCLRVHAIGDRNLPAVQRNIRSLCGRRFGDIRNRQNRCFGNLWPNFTYEKDAGSTGFFKSQQGRSFRHYTTGLSQMLRKTKFCVQKYLTEPCKSTPIRVIKTVRGNMEMATDLLDVDPHLRVVHLLRDPRGVTRSRGKATWSRGFYDSLDRIRTAQVYCTTALDNIKKLRASERSGDRVMQIVLEDFVRSPGSSVKELQSFLGVELNQSNMARLRNKMRTGFENKWKKEFSSETIKRINRACAGLLQELNIKDDSFVAPGLSGMGNVITHTGNATSIVNCELSNNCL